MDNRQQIREFVSRFVRGHELGDGEDIFATGFVNSMFAMQLVQFVESKARELGVAQLFALSTQAFTYFQSKAGFTEGTPDDLPLARREKYERSGRNSKVLTKLLR